MNILSLLKFLFPKPNVPQKRYITLVVAILYSIFQFYQPNIKDKYDDQLIENAHNIAMQLLANNQSINSNNQVIEQEFGEKS